MLNISRHRVNDEVIQKYNLQALSTLSTPRTGIRFARMMRVIMVIVVVTLFLPWQQNIRGTGNVTAFSPTDRPQNIQNTIPGRIEKWYVNEGDLVQAGDTILALSEIKDEYLDPQVLSRTQEQIEAKRSAITSYEAKVVALDQQIEALRSGLQLSLQKARNKVDQARLKVANDSTDLIAQRTNYQIAQSRLQRYEVGYKDGLFSLTDLETRRLKLQEDYAKLISQENKLGISRQELINARIELGSLQAEYQDKISKAISDRSTALSSVADAQSELSKLANKFSSIEERQDRYIVKAPQSGYVVRTLKAGIGETIKDGESVATLQPHNPDRAVELYIRPTDVALVNIGREVRLEFDGWPALQFAGWPEASIGTFGGIVQVVDQVNSANGQFRLLVSPKPGEEWPEAIRLGSGVYGWVMLNDVPVWYEIWRQLNGFPPDLNQKQLDKITGTPKEEGKK
ncbi:HlyD family secretion protein [Telluribacter sp. SYSU D00476]|uniref:HlyD family secretion protein n=1 Tax=Telluribacter sp. SYSU D00476 TaxID=2811430 RepID=UPI001FF2FDC0|nr:HlyD family efflux transporter periplasmic adaptor subunit [Telluribacter sp. SYSU D00476]